MDPIGGVLKTPGNTIAPLLVSADRAAQALGMSLDSFERYVQPELRLLGSGAEALVPTAELRRWAALSADDQRRPRHRAPPHSVPPSPARPDSGRGTTAASRSGRRRGR